MMLNACGSVASGVSPLSVDGSSVGGSCGESFFFGRPTSTIESNNSHHDIMAMRKKDANGRSVKHHCVICGRDTHSECSHPCCQNKRKIHTNNKGTKQELFGTPVCSLSCGTRPGHRDKCLVEHRIEFARLEASESGLA